MRANPRRLADDGDIEMSNASAARLHALARIDLRDTGVAAPDAGATADETRRGSEN